jgi:Transglutaminase-like enzymes, putative cysteine proteases
LKYDDLKYLAVQLPEDILREKMSGGFDRAREMIYHRLQSELPYSLKCRLELELKNLDHMESCYTLSRKEALKQVREQIPDLVEEEFNRLQFEGKIDWIYLEGKVMYSDSFCATLFKVYPDLWKRSVNGDESDYRVLEDLISDLDDGQEISCHIHIRQELSVAPEALYEGRTLYAHMPVPLEKPQIRNLRLIEIRPEPKYIAPDTAPQPTVYFEETARKDLSFSVEYSFDHVVRYIDLSKVDLERISASALPEDVLPFLKEELPHIQFSPYLKSLADELKETETNPLLIARRFYDFITTRTDYRFVRDYACIDNLPEYCALNLKGDCGVQALLFITLCRIAGIPARWQSGIDAKPGDVGEHDWARFYIPSLGWLYADPSYGGSSYIRGAYKRWNYFFGNVDPYRIPINTDFQKDFDPPKRFWRLDPYDNQCGEIEYDDHGIYGSELIYSYHEIDIHRIK